MTRANPRLLVLGITTLIFGSLYIVALFLARNEYQLSEAKGLGYVLMGLVGGFMFLFGYIPLSVYKDQRSDG